MKNSVESFTGLHAACQRAVQLITITTPTIFLNQLDTSSVRILRSMFVGTLLYLLAAWRPEAGHKGPGVKSFCL